MQEMSDGSWIPFEESNRLLKHRCISSGGYQ